MVDRGNLLKEERGEFTLIEPLNYHVEKNGGTIVKLLRYRSVDGISYLIRHFRQVLTSKKSSEHRNLSVDVDRQPMNLRWAKLHAAETVELPRTPIGPKQGN